MASYFFDTSALMRRYLLAEPGALRVAEICRPDNGHHIVITRLVRVEVASAFLRAMRRGAIDDANAHSGWREFRQHARSEYRFVEVDDLMLDHAADLVFRHAVRAYDAVHLAAALRMRSSAGLILDFRFCTADATQADAADREGLTVELIA